MDTVCILHMHVQAYVSIERTDSDLHRKLWAPHLPDERSDGGSVNQLDHEGLLNEDPSRQVHRAGWGPRVYLRKRHKVQSPSILKTKRDPFARTYSC